METLNTNIDPTTLDPIPVDPVTQEAKTFQYYQKRANSIIAGWRGDEMEKIRIRRDARKNVINVNQLRQDNKILSDETQIPDRTIDYNVRTQKAQYVQYLEGSRRNLIFGVHPSFPLDERDEVSKLEDNFTQGMRYNRWKSPWFKCFDSTCLHGANFVEVIFDPSKPFNCAVDYIRREDLQFPENLTNIQSAELILRRYKSTMTEIEGMAKAFGFNLAGVQSLKQISDGMSSTDERMYEIYKAYYKQSGIVWTAWYSEQFGQEWLSTPKKLDLGIKDLDKAALEVMTSQGTNPSQVIPQLAQTKDITFYPVFALKYDEVEDEVILNVPGRAALDLQTQEAITHLFSANVNGNVRASGLYASPVPSNDGVPPTDRVIATLQHGKVVDRPLSFFQMDYPSPGLLTAIQALRVSNQSQMGQTDFAALTRQDTEKTATEIQAAQAQKASLSSMQVNLLATVITDVYSLCWEIARWQTMLGLCRGPLVPPGQDPALTIKLLNYPYVFSAAGDVEVIQRAEKKQSLREIWQIMKDTPAAQSVLEYILELYFPDEADNWINDLKAPTNQVIEALVGIITTAIQEQRLQVSPDELQSIAGILTTAQSMVRPTGQQDTAPELSAPQIGPAQPGGQPLQPSGQ